MSLQINKRTHCVCGEVLAPVKEVGGNWGDWRCRKCWFRYCQDCGSHLDQNDECIAYRDFEDESAGASGVSAWQDDGSQNTNMSARSVPGQACGQSAADPALGAGSGTRYG